MESFQNNRIVVRLADTFPLNPLLWLLRILCRPGWYVSFESAEVVLVAADVDGVALDDVDNADEVRDVVDPWFETLSESGSDSTSISLYIGSR